MEKDAVDIELTAAILQDAKLVWIVLMLHWVVANWNFKRLKRVRPSKISGASVGKPQKTWLQNFRLWKILWCLWVGPKRGQGGIAQYLNLAKTPTKKQQQKNQQIEIKNKNKQQQSINKDNNNEHFTTATASATATATETATTTATTASITVRWSCARAHCRLCVAEQYHKFLNISPSYESYEIFGLSWGNLYHVDHIQKHTLNMTSTCPSPITEVQVKESQD